MIWYDCGLSRESILTFFMMISRPSLPSATHVSGRPRLAGESSEGHPHLVFGWAGFFLGFFGAGCRFVSFWSCPGFPPPLVMTGLRTAFMALPSRWH